MSHSLWRYFRDKVAIKEKRVQSGSVECSDCVKWRIDYGFAFEIEARVQHSWHARLCSEALDQIVVTLVLIASNRLHAGAAVDMHRRSDVCLLWWPDLKG